MNNRVILITGASAGIGEATARLLATSSNTTVIAAARRVHHMQHLSPYGIRIMELDVTKEESAKNCINTILHDYGRIDVLINNAGFGLHGALETIDINNAKYQFDVNVFGLMRITQLVLPIMREQKSGTIVNVSSIVGRISVPMTGWYCATKHAVEALSDALRLEVEPFGIKVIIIEPGPIKTEFKEIAINHALSSLEQTQTSNAYDKQVKSWTDYMNHAYKAVHEPDIIAKLILKAISTDKPKLRYAAPFRAYVLLLLKKFLPDWIADTLIRHEISRSA